MLGWGRIYGGQVVAQALRAAGLTVDEHLRAHSLHAYFVQAGDERQPVLYEVERAAYSGKFATRQVVAYQARGAVLNLIASFHRPEDSIDLPAISAPSRRARAGDVRGHADRSCISNGRDVSRGSTRSPRAGMDPGSRAAGRRPDAPASSAYCSDEFPLGTALERIRSSRLGPGVHGQPGPRDWFHRPLRADEWLLYELRGRGASPTAGAGLRPGLRP